MEDPKYDDTLPTPVNEGGTEDKGLDQTIPVPARREPESPPPSKPAKKGVQRPSWPLLTVGGLAALLLIAVASAFSGYRSGIDLRKGAEATQVAQRIDEQFNLGIQDMASKNYDRARQRFEYVIRLDPNYPGVTEKLADVLLQLNTTATPTVAPTPTLTPTPDLRGVDELFSQAQQSLANSDWNTTIDTLLNLRKADPTYHTVDVDDMLFLALRNRGVDKILKKADLEGGIYDLTLAERFGPLDTEAQGFQNWARLYITGASFWEIDWSQAVYYFAQVAPALPNLRDGSGLTATERYRLALIGYGDTLAKQEEWCDAQSQYEQALSLGSDAKAEESLAEVTKNCRGISDEEPPAEENPQPTEPPPAEGVPTQTPEGEPSPTAYPAP